MESIAKIKTSLLNLVDLAGSERQRDAQTAGLRLKVCNLSHSILDCRVVCSSGGLLSSQCGPAVVSKRSETMHLVV